VTVRIVTDSSCDLPDSIVTRFNITVIPLYINIGDKSYLDGIEMTHEQFYAGLPYFTRHPTTSVPGPGQLVKVYEDLAGKGATAIISIHISSSLSAMLGVALLAAQEVHSTMVTVVDSGNLTLGTGLMVLKAAKMAEEGIPPETITAALEDQAARTYCIATVDTLVYLKRSGRLSRFQATLGSILQIKPLLRMNAGAFEMERTRTRSGATQRLIALANQLAPYEELALVHTNAPQRAVQLGELVSYLFPGGVEPIVAEVTPVIGSHIGPGVVGLVAVQANIGGKVSNKPEAAR
jgi:DegV family protein with EDD domain